MKQELFGQVAPSEEWFIRELDQRISNELLAADGMVCLAINQARGEEARLALRTVRSRLQDYASVHRALRMPVSTEATDVLSYMLELCRSISRSRLEHRKILLTIAGQSVMLDAQRCRLLGIIVYELINNAARHALGEAGGEIRVEVCSSGDCVSCSVWDSGSAHGNEGELGLIRELSMQLDGVFERRIGPTGLESAVTFLSRS